MNGVDRVREMMLVSHRKQIVVLVKTSFALPAPLAKGEESARQGIESEEEFRNQQINDNITIIG